MRANNQCGLPVLILFICQHLSTEHLFNHRTLEDLATNTNKKPPGGGLSIARRCRDFSALRNDQRDSLRQVSRL